MVIVTPEEATFWNRTRIMYFKNKKKKKVVMMIMIMTMITMMILFTYFLIFRSTFVDVIHTL
jgi:accessory gene regulator protein AgrB